MLTAGYLVVSTGFKAEFSFTVFVRTESLKFWTLSGPIYLESCLCLTSNLDQPAKSISTN